MRRGGHESGRQDRWPRGRLPWLSRQLRLRQALQLLRRARRNARARRSARARIPVAPAGPGPAHRTGLEREGSLCVGAQPEGAVYTSRDLTAGGAGWSRQLIVGTTPPTSISCPSADLCVGVNAGGDVFGSADPGAASPSWSVFPELDQAEFSHVLNGIDCPEERLCVAVGDDGEILTGTTPLGGAAAWSASQLPTFTNLTAVSCPSPGACVATAQDGTIYASTDPLGGGATWSPSFADPEGGLNAISCPTTGFCAAVDGWGNAVVSTTPFAPSGWSHFRIDQNNYTSSGGVRPQALVDISCPTANLCLAVGGFDGLISSEDPVAGGSAWTTGNLLSPTSDSLSFSAVACPTTDLCALGASGDAGQVWTSIDPGAGTAGGRLVEDVAASSPFYGIATLSCASESFCAAADHSGSVVTGSR